ncbi:serine/threonine-protein kinase [Streptomyces goshikiensis]|uniref:serine/threonine-protein kinase n=1 Tax=Streptomyces goshikiensis TaxID=1942 RepID=UPI002ADF14DA|nr:serine/threonine-protein kinase [Streptomyces goshikiensis]
MDDLLGRYRLLDVVGSGGMGQVRRAHDLALDRDVAVKTIRGPVQPNALARFEREARAAGRLSGHPHVVAVYDFGRHRVKQVETVFIVMELVPGRSLQQVAAQTPPDVRTALRWVLHIARALQAAHAEGILHRDIKPANAVLVESADRPNDVKVLDFGIAALAEEPSRLTETGAVPGTRAYMAPELWAEGASTASDLYALGVVLYEFLTGRLPFLVAPARVDQAVPNLARPLVELADALLARDPKRRPSTAGEVCTVLEAVMNDPFSRLDGVGYQAADGQAGLQPGPGHTVLDQQATAPSVTLSEPAQVPQWRRDALTRRVARARECVNAAEAAEMYRVLLPEAAVVEGDESDEYLLIRWLYGERLRDAGQHAEAAAEVVALMPQLLAMDERQRGLEGVRWRVSAAALTLCLARRAEEAVRMITPCMDRVMEELGPYDAESGYIRQSLAQALANLGRSDEAVALLEGVVDDIEEGDRGRYKALPFRVELGRLLCAEGCVEEGLAELADALFTAQSDSWGSVYLPERAQREIEKDIAALRSPAKAPKRRGLFRRH